VLNELIHSGQWFNRGHLFHAGRQSAIWLTLSFGWSRLTAQVDYRHAIPLQTVW